MNAKECVFCKIVSGEIKTDFIIKTEDIVAFKDIHPQAPSHALVIPKKHFASLNELEDLELMGKLIAGVQQTAMKLGIESAYRTVVNTGKGAGQVVFHVHFHVIGGRTLQWPPG